jgi:hypothetical protein
LELSSGRFYAVENQSRQQNVITCSQFSLLFANSSLSSSIFPAPFGDLTRSTIPSYRRLLKWVILFNSLDSEGTRGRGCYLGWISKLQLSLRTFCTGLIIRLSISQQARAHILNQFMFSSIGARSLEEWRFKRFGNLYRVQGHTPSNLPPTPKRWRHQQNEERAQK